MNQLQATPFQNAPRHATAADHWLVAGYAIAFTTFDRERGYDQFARARGGAPVIPS